MPFFRRPDYQSDTTQFIAELRQQRPQLEASQRQGRALLWDHRDRKSTRLNSSHSQQSRMPSSA